MTADTQQTAPPIAGAEQALLAEVLTPNLLRRWIEAHPGSHQLLGWLLLYLNDAMGQFVGWDNGFFGTFITTERESHRLPLCGRSSSERLAPIPVRARRSRSLMPC